MKNFLRSLRYAWAYRYRLALSLLCAIGAALLWSVTFTAIYPVLKILSTNVSLQEWVDQRLDETQAEITRLHIELTHTQREVELINQGKATNTWPPGPDRDTKEHELAGQVARLETKLNSAVRGQYWYQQAKYHCIRRLPDNPFQTLAVLLGLVLLGVALKGVFEFGQEALVGSVTNRTLFDLRNRFFQKAIHLDTSHFSSEGGHELMARFTNDMDALGQGLKTLFGKVVAEPLKAVGCIVIACLISWQLTLLFLVLVPVAVFVLTKVARTMKRASRRLLERMSSIYKILHESFGGIRIVKGFTAEPFERRRFRAATLDYYHKAMQVVKIDALASPIIEVLGVAAVAVALLAGAYLVLHRETSLFGLRMSAYPLDAETLLALYALLAAIADPVRKLSSVFTKLQTGSAAADRIFSLFDREPKVTSNANGPAVPRHAEAVEFREVCFSYQPGCPILSNVSLRFPAGQVIALVGRNGCGKSTLLGMLSRFHDPDHGSVLIDGVDIRQAQLRSLRRQVGVVPQDVFLFDDTIYNNIVYGNRSATREQVEAAAQQALIHDIICELPNGYETRVGESGAQLSGGQKQRIALARALLRNPSILVLDEFTNQIDAESEADIHAVVRTTRGQRTTFVITHRLHTLEIADCIVVMERGRVEAVGTHAELMRTCPVYQRLHEAHFQRRAAA
jgi:ATP-binding cassette subfamily B protein/subfamily B ATP-binding cassette protein MsbA